MAKVLDQLLYSSIIYGSDQPSTPLLPVNLRLESTSSGMKGAVEIVGSHFDLITGTQIGRLYHTNSATQTYTLPDYSGTVLISGLFTAANQLLYSTDVGVFAALSALVGGALVTDGTGQVKWVTGTNNQLLTIVNGIPVFADPADNGFIVTSANANQVAYYATSGNMLSPLQTITSRALLSNNSGVLLWGLLPSTYLRASGNVPLSTGTASQILTATGDGSFAWVNPNLSNVTPGTQYRIPYYSGASPTTTLAESSFLQTDETNRILEFFNRGYIRFHEATVNGLSYIELKAPASLGSAVSFTLPASDGLTGAYLTTDGFGNLSFVYVDNGTVNGGLTNQLAYYATDGNDLSGLTTVASRVLSTTNLGKLQWFLIKSTYLSTTGALALGEGTANQVLVSAESGYFAWANVADLNGEVLSGTATHLAFYPTTGTKVDDVGFLTVDNVQDILNVLTGATVRFYPVSGTNYVGLTAPSSISSSVLFNLPAADGLSGYALLTDGAGQLSFQVVGRGIVHTGTAKTLSYYNTAVNAVYPWTNVKERAALTDSNNEIAWSLITTKYLSASGGLALGIGATGDVLTPDGFGSFQWVSAVSLTGSVSAGQPTRMAYYTAFNTVAGSGWLNNSEAQKTLDLFTGGTLRFYEPTDTYYSTFTASPLLAANMAWNLPATDAAAAGQALVSDAAGNLSFAELVDAGVQDAVAVYQNGTAKKVSPSANFFNNSLGLLLTGSLFTISGDTATNIQIKVATGKSVTFSVDTSDYLSIASGIISILTGSALRWYNAANTFYASFKAKSTLAANITWYLPTADALSAGHALVSDAAGNLSFTSLVDVGVQDAVAVYQNGTARRLSPSANFFNNSAGLQLTGSLFTISGATATDIKITSDISKSIALGAGSNLFSIDAAKVALLLATPLRWYDATNLFYTSLAINPALAANVSWVLPALDATAAGQALVSDAAGNLHFSELIDVGVQDAVAVYQKGTAKRVSPASNFFSSATGLSLTGALFTITGATSTDIQLMCSASKTINFGSGTNDCLSVSNGLVSVLKNVSLRWMDAGANYIGFAAPSSVSTSVIWTLPAGDGNLGEVLATDGLGNLNWVKTTTANIKDGVINAIAYYTNTQELSASLLLLPTSLPDDDAASFIINNVSGQLSYKLLVTPNGSKGNIGYYTSDQTIGHSSKFNWDDTNRLLKLGSGSKLVFYNLANTSTLTLASASTLSSNITITLPGQLPAANGYILTGDTTGALTFSEPSGDTRWEKRGIITLTPSIRSVTVLYDDPFSATPAGVQVQWITSSGLGYLPTYAIERSTAEGFIVRFSVGVPSTGTYKLYWQSHLTAATSLTAFMYMLGGATSSSYLDTINSIALDSNTISAISATLTSQRGYTTGGGGTTKGFVFGGETSSAVGLNTISNLTYSTQVLVDSSTSLATARSGAAGVGTRSVSYVAGGKTPSGSSHLSIEAFTNATETILTVAATLNAFSVRRGAATGATIGGIVDAHGSLELLTYSTENITVQAVSFAAVAEVGANDASMNKGYFGNDDGEVNIFNFSINTLSLLPASLNSTTGLSSAGNSLDQAYFSGDQFVDSVDFVTGTITNIASLPASGLLSSSVSTFQSKGLL